METGSVHNLHGKGVTMTEAKMYEVQIIVHYRVRVQANDVEAARERGVDTWFDKTNDEKMAVETNFNTIVTEELK